MINPKSKSYEVFNKIFGGMLDNKHLKEKLKTANFKGCSKYLEQVELC